MLKKHSKDLALSNLSRKIEDETFSVEKISVPIIKTLPNIQSESSICNSKRSLGNSAEIKNKSLILRKPNFLIEKSNEKENKEQNLQIINNDTESKPLKVKEDPKEVSNKNSTKKIDQIAELIIGTLIEDFFKDSLYKFFFFPEKIKGIKTNQNYIKLYLNELIKKASGLLIRGKIQ